MKYGRRRFAFSLAALASAALLWGCGSNGSGGSTVAAPSESPQVVGSASCQVCHSAVVSQNWVGSLHDNDAVAGCEGCHGGGQFHRGLGPIPVSSPGLEECSQCHDLSRHADDPATPGLSTGQIEGYVVTACESCHYSPTPAVTTQWAHNPATLEINRAWANSAHGGHIATGPVTEESAPAWIHYNWDDTATRGSCQRCHTATGASNFLNNPAGYAANGSGNDFSHLSDWSATGGSPQNELLYCWGCHSDVSTGGLRNPGPITETYTATTAGAPPTTVTFPDAFASNVCMGCHLGREVGDNIVNDTDADGIRGFINSHYLAAGGMVFGEAGYEYAGQDYTKSFGGHADAGNADDNGPCVTCHMTSAEPHKFEVVQKDAAGVITAVSTTACGSCHGNMNAAWLEERKETFHSALDALRQALEAKGIFFGPAHPYFFTAPYVAGGTNTAYTNWAGLYGVGAWKDVMGAAFNYNLIEHDPGAYTHNRSYALKLIADSIDFIADGVVDGAGIFTINAVEVDLLAIALELEGTTIDAKHFDGEVLVKAQFVAPPTSVDADGGSCADCHAGFDFTSNGVIVDQFAESAHGDVNGEAWLHYDWRASSRASCARCHNATAYVAKLGIESDTSLIYNNTSDNNLAGEILSCAACHTDVATGAVRTPGAYTETYSDGATFTFPSIGKSNLCIRCHSGREAGSTIAADTDADGDRSFINSHYLTAGGTVFATTGYEYAGQSYANPGFYLHDVIGIFGGADDAGPCVGCHMGLASADHTWEVVAKDAAGTITAINSDSCTTCHVGTLALTAAGLETSARQYHAALEALKAALETRGIFFFNAHPYFFNAANGAGGAFTDWDGIAVVLGLPAVPGYKDVMGAAFNYNLLEHDPGGYAHNRFYAKRLIFDAIDFIDNGVLDGMINVTGDAALYLDGSAATAGVQRP